MNTYFLAYIFLTKLHELVIVKFNVVVIHINSFLFSVGHNQFLTYVYIKKNAIFFKYFLLNCGFLIGSNIIIVINKCWFHDKSCGMSRCTKRFNHFHFHHHRRHFLLRVYFLTFTQNSHRTQSQSLTDVWQHDQDLYSGWPGRVVGAGHWVCVCTWALYI